MPTPAQINVSDVIDRSKVTNFHIGVFVLCALCLIMDGYDVQAIGFVAPALSRDWHIAPALLGSVLSAALMGVLFGSIDVYKRQNSTASTIMAEVLRCV